jgi:Septum formation
MELPSKLVLIPVAVVVIVLVVLIALLVGGDDEATRSKAVAIGAKELRVGNCITDADSPRVHVRTFAAIDCAQPHNGEVFTIIPLWDGAYRGKQAVTTKGQRGCRARLRRQATTKAFRDKRLSFKFVYPTKQSWAQGDHEVTCLATYEKPRTGKLEQRQGFQ